MGLSVKLFNDLSDGVKGKLNLITDVPGVKVGQTTINEGKIHTGVTTIFPHQGNLFRQKVPAGCQVINGFGKSVGLVQINELGTIETPIVLTNTFGVGTALNALTKHMLEENPEIGDITSTVNPIVAECNDGDISDIRAMRVSENDVFSALDHSLRKFQEGSVGSGNGMMCYDLRGGIGSSSRVIKVDSTHQFTIGALVMTNYGYIQDFIVKGRPIGQPLAKMLKEDKNKEEKGSIITVIATDAPLNSRQLKRLAKRATVGINRSGGFIGNGSGEIAFAFSTTNLVNHFSEENDFDTITRFNDNRIDLMFRAVSSCVDEAILSSMVHAKSIIDRNGRRRLNLIDACEKLVNQQPEYTQLVNQVFADLGISHE